MDDIRKDIDKQRHDRGHDAHEEPVYGPVKLPGSSAGENPESDVENKPDDRAARGQADDLKNPDRKRKKETFIGRIIDFALAHKKTAIVSGIILILLIIISLASIYALGLDVVFIVRDELLIELSPTYAVIDLENDEMHNISFSFQNRNFEVCDTRCSYELLDLYGNVSMGSKSFVLDSNQRREARFTLKAPMHGKGTRYYTFTIECNNIPSILCRTKEDPEIKTSFIVMNYNLSARQEELKMDARQDLADYLGSLESLNEMDGLVDGTRKRINSITTPEGAGRPRIIENEMISMTLSELNERADNITMLWQLSRFGEVSLAVEDEQGVLSSLREIITEEAEFLNEEIERIRGITEGIRMVIGDGSGIAESYNFYKARGDLWTASAISGMHGRMSSLYDRFQNRTFARYKTIEEEVLSVSSGYERIMKDFAGDIESLYLFAAADGIVLDIVSDRMADVGEGKGLYDESEDGNKSLDSLNDLERDGYAQYFINFSEDRPGCQEIIRLKSRADQINKTVSALELERALGAVADGIRDLGNDSWRGDYFYHHANQAGFGLNETNKTYFSPDAFENVNLLYQFRCNSTPVLGVVDVDGHNISMINLSIEKPVAVDPGQTADQCCLFGKCHERCNQGGCLDSKGLYPVIFIHGHSFNERNSPEQSLNTFAEVQRKLAEIGYVNAGQISLDADGKIPPGSWGQCRAPIAIRLSYYYLSYYDIGGWTFVTQKKDKIENYAIRLREFIRVVQMRTGAEKVRIVAHSMGGLVAREYIALFGEESVYSIIQVATPNYGITGSVKALCDVFGSSRECMDMSEGSVFLSRLNMEENIPRETKIYAIAGTGCSMDGSIGDGIVELDNALLPFSENFVINGSCREGEPASLHTDLIDPEKYPETFDLIVDLLSNG